MNGLTDYWRFQVGGILAGAVLGQVGAIALLIGNHFFSDSRDKGSHARTIERDNIAARRAADEKRFDRLRERLTFVLEKVISDQGWIENFVTVVMFQIDDLPADPLAYDSAEATGRLNFPELRKPAGALRDARLFMIEGALKVRMERIVRAEKSGAPLAEMLPTAEQSEQLTALHKTYRQRFDEFISACERQMEALP